MARPNRKVYRMVMREKSLFHPLTDRADDWFSLHCSRDQEHRYWGNELVIEHRFVADIIQLAADDGLLLPLVLH